MVFRVGQKVVCVDATGTDDDGPTIKCGQIYTISWVGEFDNPWRPKEGCRLCVHLDEVNRNPPRGDHRYSVVPYWAARFRPVVETKTDISIFQKMLTPKKDKSNVV